MENKPSKLDKLVKISIVAGILIVAISIAIYLIVPLMQKTKPGGVVEESKLLNDVEAKKQSLEKFYNELSTAGTNKDWMSLYDFEKKSVKDALTKEEYTAFMQNMNSAFYSADVIIKEMKVEGDKGIIYPVITYCITKECEGTNKRIDEETLEYEYVDGKWQKPDPDPSEKALSVATGAYLEFITKKDKDKKAFFDKYSFGKENIRLALRRYALELDENNETLIFVEKLLEKQKGSQGNSYTNFETPLQVPQYSNSSSAESAFDKVKRESDQQCQQDLAKYNTCLSEYNAKMTEYNSCLSKNADPNQTYKPYCSKPFNICMKPVCAY